MEDNFDLRKLLLSQPLFHKPDFVRDWNKKFLMKRGNINIKSKRFYLYCVSKTCPATCIYIYNDVTKSLTVHDGHPHMYNGCMLVDQDVEFKLDDVNEKFDLKLYLNRVINYCKEKNIEIKTYETTEQNGSENKMNNQNNVNNSSDVNHGNVGSGKIGENQEMFDQDAYNNLDLDIFDQPPPEEEEEKEEEEEEVLSNEEICKRCCNLYEEYKQNLKETEDYTEKQLKFVADHLSDYFRFLKMEYKTTKFDMPLIKSSMFFDSVVKYLEDTISNAYLSDKMMYHRWMQFTDFFTWLLEVNLKDLNTFDDIINVNLLNAINSISAGVKMSCKDMNHELDADGEHQEDAEYSDDDDFVLNSSKKKNSQKKRKGRNNFSNKNLPAFSNTSSKKKPAPRRRVPPSNPAPLSEVDEEKERERKKLLLQDLRKTIEGQNIKVQSQYLIFENQTLRLGTIENKIDDILKNLMNNQMNGTPLPPYPSPPVSTLPNPPPPLVQTHINTIPQNPNIVYQTVIPMSYYNPPNYLQQYQYQMTPQTNFQKPKQK